jgi:hypothetical protein
MRGGSGLGLKEYENLTLFMPKKGVRDNHPFGPVPGYQVARSFWFFGTLLI